MEWREGTKFSLPPNGPIDCVDFMASIDWLKIMINNVDCDCNGLAMGATDIIVSQLLFGSLGSVLLG